jgi:predicted ATPase/transcriptional regulator with XRE-family HTH domain
VDHANPEASQFGRWLQARRVERDLTREELAALVACSADYIKKIEQGKRRPSKQLAGLLAAQLGLPPPVTAAFLSAARGSDARAAQDLDRFARASADAARPPSNLPTPLTALLGRETLLARVVARLEPGRDRLVTLLGPAGVGKTRLALEVGHTLREAFADGVFFVDLAPIRDPALVAAQIAETLEVRESGGAGVVTSLQRHLRHKRLLLVLDNFEQVAQGGPVVSGLLRAAPDARALVTSRRRLRVLGEYTISVPPLAVPPPDSPPAPTVLQASPAVALFVERAEAVRDDFAMTAENAGAVARLCSELEGLPLALELAAARSDQFTPEAMLARLQDRLALLAGGPRDLPPRQRSLQAAIQWSFDLLAPAERQVFACLAVFAGSFSLGAATAVCGGAEGSAQTLAAALATLVEHSLLTVQTHEGEARYAMLESIRQYARKALQAAGALQATRARYREWYVRLAEQAAEGLATAEQTGWLRRLRLEQDNLRHALALIAAAPGGGEEMLRLASSLFWFWHAQGQLAEGRAWLETALARPGARADAATRARACCGVGVLAREQGDHAAARAWREESAASWRALGSGPELTTVTEALRVLSRLQGHAHPSIEGGRGRATEAEATEAESHTGETAAWLAYAGGDYAVARERFEAELARARDGRRLVQTGALLTNLGHVALAEGDYATAERSYGEALALTREAGSLRETAYCLNGLGEVARSRGAYEEAAQRYAESRRLFEQVGDRSGQAWARHNSGQAWLALGRPARARRDFAVALADFQALEGLRGSLTCLAGLVTVAAARGVTKRIPQLFSAVDAHIQRLSMPLDALDAQAFAQGLEQAQTRVSAEVWRTQWAAGRTMPLADLVRILTRDLPADDETD